MSQKIFLTSALAMGVIAPAFAEPSHTGTFPSDGYMEEDYTYTNAATSDNMDGVYSGTVNAVAEYDVINYIVNAGQYLPADSETVITCPAGSFCAGGETVQYNQSSAQGIQTCPTGYDSSADGASSNTQCYRACDINNMGTNGSIANISHATAISGNDYYGNGTDTCEPTACENGWHVKAGLPNLNQTIGTQGKQDSFSVSVTGVLGQGPNTYGLTTLDKGKFIIKYADNTIIKGSARCSTQTGTNGWSNNGDWSNITIMDSVTDDVGQTGAGNCWCKLDGYVSATGQEYTINTPWTFNLHDNNATDCFNLCSQYCVSGIGENWHTDYLGYRSFIFNVVAPVLASCEANTITINWSDASQTDIDANNAGTATYGEDVRTPVKAQTKKGKTFKGWRFSKPTETNLP